MKHGLLKKYSLGFFLLLVGAGISGCNLFDNKIQGQIGQSAAAGPDKPKLGDRTGITSEFAEYTFDEGSRQRLKFILTKKLKEGATLQWHIDSAQSDFQEVSGTVTVGPDEEEFKIDLTALNDSLYEGDESFNLVVDVDESYFATDLAIPLKITESAATPPQVSFGQAAKTLGENAGSFTLPVNLSQASANLVRIKLGLSGTATSQVDYSTTPSQDLVFSPGQTTQNITINIIDDVLTGEFLEDVTITMDEVVMGTATIDIANKHFTLLIEDNDAGASPIVISGVTGGGDGIADRFLTSGSHATVNWTAPALTDEVSFDVTIFEMDGVTIRCAGQNVGSDSITVSFPACSLSEGGSYKISVVANRVDSSIVAANNNMFSFKVDTLPPGPFSILGVMGGVDIVPDGFLAGALEPTAVWKDSQGESSYSVKILTSGGLTVDATDCEADGIPANVTSYNFEDCHLSAGGFYKIRVSAKDDTGLVTSATDYLFEVTNNTSGYMILGVKGGVGDTTVDAHMDDGNEPIVRWQKALGATGYEAEILTTGNAPIPGCAPQVLDGSYSEVTMVGCDLNLNDEYHLVVKANIGGTWTAAANSPFPFRHRVGLYISGSGGSYINGQSIKTCGTSGECNLTTPYEVSTSVKYDKIRIANSGYLIGKAWTGNNPTVGNGILTIEAITLVVESNSVISMDGKGYTATQGPGAGSSGANGNGASHGGLGGLTVGSTQGPVYGNALNPLDLGSGGGNGSHSSDNLGGAGGGAINITVKNLSLSSGRISANGVSGGLGSCMGIGCSYYRNGGGAGSGGSIKIVTDLITGSSAKIQVNGGNGPANVITSAGGGGRIALEYKENTYGSFASLFEAFGAVTKTSAHAETSSAAGTVFYKNTSSTGGDANGHLLIDNNNIARVQGVETPIPLSTFDSITTARKGILIIPSTDMYLHPNNVVDFDLVVAGTLILSVDPNNLQIGTLTKTSYFEWRRQDPLSFATVAIEKGSVLSHSKNGTSTTYRLVMNTTDLNVRGAIDVSGKGFYLESGPGKATGRHGASHGGLGGLAGSGAGSSSRSTVHGSIKTPTALGSGGASYGANLPTDIGIGGGSVEINTTNLSLIGERPAATKTAGYGEIRADGLTGQDSGGAGGSIWINAANVVGKNGTITVNGGGSTYGAGSGGRISIVYQKDDEYLAGAPKDIWSELSTGVVEVSAQGGDGNKDGAAGTIFLKKTATGADANDIEPMDTHGRLWVFNGTRDYEELTTTLITENTLFDSIRTDTKGTIHIPSGMTYTLPSSEISYRIISEGDFNPTANLKIKDGGYLEWRKISPLIVAGTMTIESLGELTHSKNDLTRQYMINVQADNFVIAGKVNAQGKGYGKGMGPGAPEQASWGAAHAGWGADSNAVPQGSGKPYGMDSATAPFELGSGGYCTAGGGAIWLQAPSGSIDLSGTIDASSPDADSVCLGGNSYGTGSGGSIYIKASQMNSTRVTGTSPIISANGGRGGYISSGGTMRNSYSGSGGRIAIDVTTDNVSDGGLRQAVNDNNIMAIGGKGSGTYGGAAGTIYLKTDKKYLYLNNDNLPHKDRIETPIPTATFDETYTLGNGTLVVTEGQIYQLNPSVLKGRLVVAGVFSTIDNDLTVDTDGYLQWRRTTPLVLDKLTIKNNGTVTHTNNLSDAQYRFELDANELDLQAGGKIDVTGKGYQPYGGPGGSTTSTGGGAYGGNSRTAYAYGSVTNPSDLGSGGGYLSGGGNVQLRIKNLTTIAGKILADGKSGYAPGAGGTVFIDAGVSAGGILNLRNGYEISASGGQADVNSESGTGGRIAIYYDVYDGTGGPASIADAVGLSSTSVKANGGAGAASTYSAAGTIFYQKKGVGTGTLVVKNNGTVESDERTSTPLPDGANFDNLIIDKATTIEVKSGQSANLPADLQYRLILSGAVSTPGNTLNIKDDGVLEIRRGAVVNEFDTIVIESGGLLTHSKNTMTKSNWAHLDVNTLNIQTGGTIDVSGKGFSMGQGPGAGCSPMGGTYVSGGSYGGMGNKGKTNCSRVTYGSIKNPTDLGSAGGAFFYGSYGLETSGAGGGLVKIEATSFTLNGQILANGKEGTCYGSQCGGAGSGGTININTDTLLGAGGSLMANGGIQELLATEIAAGGGGRIAMTVNTTNSYTGSVTMISRGGHSSLPVYPAAAGTIYTKLPLDTNGNLLISNIDTPYTSDAVTELFSNDTFDDVKVGNSASEAAKTGIGVRKSTTFRFPFSDVNFPLKIAGNAKFDGAAGPHSGNVNIKSGGILELAGIDTVKFNNIVIESGGVLTHSGNSTAMANLLNLEASSLEIQSGGKISVTGKGYASASGLGAGKGSFFPMKPGGGASFGGLGGTSAATGLNGSIYGDNTLTANYLGSGGGAGSNDCAGGSGGGGIYLTLTSLTLNSGGIIEANGAMGLNNNPINPVLSCQSGGGGSGGAIKIVATNIATDLYSGMPQIFARGGGIAVENPNDSNEDGGAGGGGRVYIEYQNSALSDSNISSWISVTGGSAEAGAAPTLNGGVGTATVVDAVP